jgi:hypothetical protein
MPLIYNSLESDHPPVQEKALEGVPKLCSALDYGTIEIVLLVKVAVCDFPCCPIGMWRRLTHPGLLSDSVYQNENSERQSEDAGVLSPDGPDSRQGE